MNDKFKNTLNQLKDAFASFEDVMKQEKNEYIRDSAIQRFEYTFELTWKLLKIYLEEKGIKVYAPRDVIKESFQVGILPDDITWLNMLETRNQTSHLYKKSMAEDVYGKLPLYLKLIDNLMKSFE